MDGVYVEAGNIRQTLLFINKPPIFYIVQNVCKLPVLAVLHVLNLFLNYHQAATFIFECNFLLDWQQMSLNLPHFIPNLNHILISTHSYYNAKRFPLSKIKIVMFFLACGNVLFSWNCINRQTNTIPVEYFSTTCPSWISKAMKSCFSLKRPL